MRYAQPRAVIFDDTALLALGSGTPMASQLVVEAMKDPSLHVYVPAVCLAMAETERAGVAEHVGALPSVDITEFGFAAATAVGKQIRTSESEGWGGAHALHLARPSVEWPLGRPVVTRTPSRYKGTGIRTIRIPEA